MGFSWTFLLPHEAGDNLVQVIIKDDGSKEVSILFTYVFNSFPSMSIFSIDSLSAQGYKSIEVIIAFNFYLTLAYF